VVERIDIGKTVADGTRQRGVALEQRLLSSDRQYGLDRVVPFGLEPREDRAAPRLVGRINSRRSWSWPALLIPFL
jgi:hypothetical protein